MAVVTRHGAANALAAVAQYAPIGMRPATARRVAIFVLLTAFMPLSASCVRASPAAAGAFGRPAAGAAERRADFADIFALNGTGCLYVAEKSVDYGDRKPYGRAKYTLKNAVDAGGSGDGMARERYALPYIGGLYFPAGVSVTLDGATIPYEISLDWQSGPEKGSPADPAQASQSFEYDAGKEYSLYIIRVKHNQIMEKSEAYVGADFILDSSKTRIVADGFGYAANPYGAVRIRSLSDGFDTGLERRVFVIGKDVELDVRAYEDADLTREAGAPQVEVERQALTIRDYLLAYSAPYAATQHNPAYAPGPTAGAVSGATPDTAGASQPITTPGHAPDTVPGAMYADSLYRVYKKALDDLLEIHYFIPRGELYAKAETPRVNAIVFDVAIPAESGGALIEIEFPLNLASSP